MRTNESRPPEIKYRWFHGIDQAKSPDFMTVYINGLGPKPKDGKNWLPLLRDVYRFHHDDYVAVFKWYTGTVCKKYPPTRITIDITNNVMMGDSIIRRFGKRNVDAQRFQNQGSTNTKYTLKQIGLDYFKMGYTLPNPDNITDPLKSEIIKTLKSELLREQIKLTPSGRPTFGHGGKHNDNVHGLELSLSGVMFFQKHLFDYDISKLLVFGVPSAHRKNLEDLANEGAPNASGSVKGLSPKTYEQIMQRFKQNSNTMEITNIEYSDEPQQ